MTEGIVMRFNFYIMFSLPLFHSKSLLTLTELDVSPIANTMVRQRVAIVTVHWVWWSHQQSPLMYWIGLNQYNRPSMKVIDLGMPVSNNSVFSWPFREAQVMVAFQGYRFGRGAINEVLNNSLFLHDIAGGRSARLVNARLQSIPVFLRFIPVFHSLHLTPNSTYTECTFTTNGQFTSRPACHCW